MKHIETFKQKMINESLNKGDSVRLTFALEADEDDGEYGISVDEGEIGKISYLVSSTKNKREEDKVYMVRFPDKDGKKRIVGLTKLSLEKV